MKRVCSIHGVYDVDDRAPRAGCPHPSHRRDRPRTELDRVRSTARWQRVRSLAAARDDYRCTYGLEAGDRGAQAYPDGRCPVEDGLDGHHRVALEDGGEPYDLDNIRTVCRTHHGQLEAERRRSRHDA